MKILVAVCLFMFVTVASSNPNVRIVENLLDDIKEVEQAIGKKVDPQLAIQIKSCSKQAAHKGDPGKVGKGVDFKKINPKKAIAECKRAYNNGGSDIGLVLASLSRAYNKAENYERSLYYAKKAVEVGYPFGSVMMAIHYHYGDGVKKSKKGQFRWYKKAATKGVTLAMRTTADNYLKGDGTSVDVEEAYFWAINAVENTDPKGFYQLGKILEKKAEQSSNPIHLLQLARQSFEVAGANYVSVKKDIHRVNAKLSPNHIADDSVLFAKTIKGRKVNGVFIPNESNSAWYLADKPLTRDGHTYYYARTSYNNTIFTLWYKQGDTSKNKGWFIYFFYAGSNTLKEFNGVNVLAKLDGKTNYIKLDIAGQKVQELPGTYRLTARISYRDVLILQNGEQVKFYYTTKSKATPNYTMNLNREKSTENAEEGAQSVISALTKLVSQADSQCCEKPEIIPLSKSYQKYHKFCEERSYSQFLQKKKVIQDCHNVLKAARPSVDYLVKPLATNLARLLKEIEEAAGISAMN